MASVLNTQYTLEQMHLIETYITAVRFVEEDGALKLKTLNCFESMKYTAL